MVTRYGPLLSERHKKVESIQRRATKLISELKDKTCEERLRELELPSLVYRRRREDMILMFKVKNGLVRVDISVLFTPTRLGHTRAHTRKVYKDARVNTFSRRVVNDWNALQNYVIKAPSLNSFKKKKRLDKHW